MQTQIDKEILLSNNADFYNEYFELLTNRVTHSSMSLELDLGNPDNSNNAIRLKDNMKAFRVLINALQENEVLSEEMIKKIANIINSSSKYISEDYRKIGKYLADTTIAISTAENIAQDMQRLLSKYQNDWKELDVFEREARFHIEFIRIHPFEDGNGRTSRLLLNFNLLKQMHAPVIITTDLIEYYHTYIRNNDIEGMKNIFKIQSQRECEIVNQLYREYKEKENSKNTITK